MATSEMGSTGTPATRLHHRTGAVHFDLIIGRLIGAGLLVWMAWIHRHLWSDGYKHLHIVGPLFLLNAIGGALVALAVVVVPLRWLSLTAAAGALVAAGTLAGLAISINIGLFGFKDYFNTPFARLSVWVECAATVVLAAVAVRAWAVGRPRRAASSPA
jgi:hypothetical protein